MHSLDIYHIHWYIDVFLILLFALYKFHEIMAFCSVLTTVDLALTFDPSSPDGQPLLLPPDQVQELNQRSTAMLSGVQRLFAHHLIEAFGCDYSSSGVTLEALSAKIKTFLELRTADGPRHDTYLIYYSGHCHPSGEWALAGEEGVGGRGHWA